MESKNLEIAVGKILSTITRKKSNIRFEKLSASGNNRVFALYSEQEKFLLKWYYRDITDSRDRLGVEFSFLEHAWSIGLRCIPKPLIKDKEFGIGVYEFIQGNKLQADQLTPSIINQAANFFSNLNNLESRLIAINLPEASEASFSLNQHFIIIDHRLSKLGKIPINNKIDIEALELINKLKIYWEKFKLNLIKDSNKLGINQFKELPFSQRCLSPSDFGFHNAIIRENGQICFIDFEYAGWDDPAKAIGDFFSHPGVPVSHELFESFMKIALSTFEKNEVMAVRARMLEPLFKLRWCCIILNEFLPEALKRRQFANALDDTSTKKNLQLDKARVLFESIIRLKN